MKKVFYIVENRKTKTNTFISDTRYSKYADAKEYFNRLVDDKKHYKGETILLLKQTYLINDEDENDIELLEEDFIEEVEF